MSRPVPASGLHRWWWHPVTVAGALATGTVLLAAAALVVGWPSAFGLLLVWLGIGGTAGFATSGST
jgi:hypothetical protein